MPPKAKPPAKPAVKKAVKKAAPKKPAAKAAAKPAATGKRTTRATAAAAALAANAGGDQQPADDEDDGQVQPQEPARKLPVRKAAGKAVKKAVKKAVAQPELDLRDSDDEDDVPLIKAKGKGRAKKGARAEPEPEPEPTEDDEDDEVPLRPTRKARGKQVVGPDAPDDVNNPPLGLRDRPDLKEVFAANRKRKASAQKDAASKKTKTPAPTQDFIGFGNDSQESDDGRSAHSYDDREHTDGERPHRNKIEAARKRIRVAALKASPPDFQGQIWQLGDELGAGTFGAAYVCYLTDEDGNITQRMAIKDMYHDRGQYLDWTHWDGDPRDTANREHMEIIAMKALKDAGATKCVRYISHNNDFPGYFTRVFMAYYPHGSLHDLIVEEHRGGRSGKGKLEKRAIGHWIPEPALWKFFEDLVETCLFMAYGGPEEAETADPGDYRKPYNKNMKWRKIVHRDFKPQNVFLGPPHDTEWPSYPTAHLGDYGQAVFTHAKDEFNPTAYNNYVGTPGYRPFEISSYSTKSTLNFVTGPQIGDATNVWGAGCTILRLMNRQMETKYLGPTYMSKESLEPEILEQAEEHYSRELSDLVRQCVRYKPADRVTLEELLDSIRTYTGLEEDVQDQAQHMRTEAHDEDDEDLKLQYKVDSYRIGFAPAPEK